MVFTTALGLAKLIKQSFYACLAPKSYHELNESTQFAYISEKTIRRQDLRPHFTKSVQKKDGQWQLPRSSLTEKDM